jgi:hypothetical protein
MRPMWLTAEQFPNSYHSLELGSETKFKFEDTPLLKWK